MPISCRKVEKSHPTVADPANSQTSPPAAQKTELSSNTTVDHLTRQNGEFYFAIIGDIPRVLDNDDHTYVDCVRNGLRGNGAARWGDVHWRRLTEEQARWRSEIGLSVRRAGIGGEVQAGIPWLASSVGGDRVHFWPFDGWDIPARRSAVAEVYPSLWSYSFDRDGRTGDQHDAYCITAWLSRADRDGQPRRLPEPRPLAARTHAGAGGALDTGRSRLDPRARANPV
jgi:hypothetical protein